jgi:hypothetical protein
MGIRPPSRQSLYHWVNFPKPPKKDMILWKEFVVQYLQPLVTNNIIRWSTDSTPHYKTTHMISSINHNLYTCNSNGYTKFPPRQYKRQLNLQRYQVQGEHTTPPPEIISSLTPVDVAHFKTYIQLLCPSKINDHRKESPNPSDTDFHGRYKTLPTTLQRLCGEIQIPPDGGKRLIDHLTAHKLPLIGMSDASLTL